MSRYRLSAPADVDLTTIFWHGLERFGVAQTERYLDELERVFAFLSDYPEAARLRTELNPPVRAYPHEAHMIIYEIEAAGVAILRIRSARENWISNPIGADK